MICLFDKRETDFSGNGIAVLNPTVCTVSETAGGSYTLRMEHPIDEEGLHTLIQDEMIIRSPVPPTHVPSFQFPEARVWMITNTTTLWKSVPTSRRIPCPEDIKQVKQNPSAYAWRSGLVYLAGMLVTSNGNIYRARVENYSTPVTDSNTWNYETTVAGSGDTIEPIAGVAIETLEVNTTVAKIADYYGGYIQAKVPSGKTGYISKNDCEETSAEQSGTVVDTQDITEQLFRVFNIEYEDDEQSIIVDAKHISYDFQGNGIKECKINGAEPLTAIAILQGGLLDIDDRTIGTNISGKTINADWSYLNPVNALLDPERGFLSQLGASLIRNNQDFYFLDNSNPRNGIRLAYGKNLVGVKWRQSSENVVTRIMPHCGDGNNGTLYLDSIYVESDISANYAVQRLEIMDCGYSVGDEYEKADGTTITLTEETAKQQMEEDARKRFDVDKADALLVELEVNFLLLGDTEEYKQYKGLENVCLYDMIEVETGKSGMFATAQVTEYEYDSILKRFNYIKVGDVRSLMRRIPGYRMKNGSITYNKLGNDVITKIRSSQ